MTSADRITELESQLSAARQELERVTGERDGLRRLNKNNATVSDQTVGHLQSLLAAAESERDDLRSELEAARSQVRELTGALEPSAS